MEMTELTRVPPRAEAVGERARSRGLQAPGAYVPRDLRLRRLPPFRTEQEKRRDRLNLLYLLASVLILVLILVTR